MTLTPGFLLTKKIPLTLIRSTAGSYVDGVWVEGTETNVEIQVNIQPLKEAELLILPEADRSRQWWKVYSASEIRMDKQGTSGWAADEFVYQGDRYKFTIKGRVKVAITEFIAVRVIFSATSPL